MAHPILRNMTTDLQEGAFGGFSGKSTLVSTASSCLSQWRQKNAVLSE